MTGAERGFLLLTGTLGDPERKPLTAAQLRALGARIRSLPKPEEERELTAADLTALGFGPEAARHVVELLEDRELLEVYLRRGSRAGCVPVTRVTESYPGALRRKLGVDCPGCLWARGDLSLLETPMVSLVGSRDLEHENRVFARQVGEQAAKQGFTLVSGNARGADKTAQNACLDAGGKVISVVADELERREPEENLLYLSEEGFDLTFTAQRALSRNRVIHCLGEKTFVAQCAAGSGGTWDGTSKNLRFGWSGVFCYADGSEGSRMLGQLGARLIGMEMLADLRGLQANQMNLFDQ